MTAEMVKYASLKKRMKEFGIWWVWIPNFGNGDFSNFGNGDFSKVGHLVQLHLNVKGRP